MEESADVSLRIDELIRVNVLPPLIALLSRSDTPNLQLEATWAITNIAAGSREHASAIVAHGGLSILCNLLSSDHVPLARHAAWAIGNLAADDASHASSALACSIVPPLLRLLEPSAPV